MLFDNLYDKIRVFIGVLSEHLKVGYSRILLCDYGIGLDHLTILPVLDEGDDHPIILMD